MGSRKDILKNLGIPEYPWSSDDDDPPTDPRPPPNSNSLRPSAQQATSSAGPSGLPARNHQTRELFYSLLNSVPRSSPAGNSMQSNPSNERMNYRNHNDITYLSRAPHVPAPELRERADRAERADLDIQRVLAFKRLTRTVNGGHRYSRYSVPRGPSRPGAVVPSENNSGCVRLPYYRRVNRNAPTNNIPGSARQVVVDHAPARPSSAVPPRRRTYMEIQNSGDESEEPIASTTRSSPPPAPSPAPPPSPPPADEEPRGREDEEPTEPASQNETSTGSGVALVEEIVEIVDEPATIDMGLIDRARAVMPSSTDPNLASTSRSEEVDGAEIEQQNHGVKRKRHDSAEDRPSDPFTVKEFNQSLLRLLECPVCLEWMEPPMSQCRRGHLVCNRCRARLASCPVCRTTFSSVRNRAMEGVAEMLRYPCRHGCGREVRLRKRAPHEASCAARKYLCPAPLCADRLPLPRDQLADHFRSRHLHLVKLGAQHHFGIKVNSEAHENWLIMALDEFFHMKVDVDIRTWGVIVYVAYIGPKCNAMDFAYEVSIDGQHNSRKMSYKRATHSDLESSSLNVSRQDCFHLTLDQALNFIRFKNRHCDAEKYLEFNVEISRIEPPPSRDDDDS